MVVIIGAHTLENRAKEEAAPYISLSLLDKYTILFVCYGSCHHSTKKEVLPSIDMLDLCL